MSEWAPVIVYGTRQHGMSTLPLQLALAAEYKINRNNPIKKEEKK